MAEVTLFEVLKAREERSARQKAMLQKNGMPLICFTMNIAGKEKNSPIIERAFDEGIFLILEKLSQDKIKDSLILRLKTGCEGYFSVSQNAVSLKKICVEIEESSRLGRLFDIDVLDETGKKLERENERACLICGKKGRYCAVKRAHSEKVLFNETQKIITDYFKIKDGKRVAGLAIQSLVDEVETTVKPGLVDRRNCGSHKDMNIETFYKSAAALKDYFFDAFIIGAKNINFDANKVFPILKERGIGAEKEMLRASGGVNTHKGAIYSMGLVVCAVGRLWKVEKPFFESEQILFEAKALSQDAVSKDFEKIGAQTAGGRLFIESGVRGIRGESEKGFPSVLKFSLPAFKKAVEDGRSKNDAGLFALLYLISNIEDTNLLKRGGKEGSLFAKTESQKLLQSKSFPKRAQFEALDDAFIEKNLSPGGCADLLALTIFLYELEKLNPDD